MDHDLKKYQTIYTYVRIVYLEDKINIFHFYAIGQQYLKYVYRHERGNMDHHLKIDPSQKSHGFYFIKQSSQTLFPSKEIKHF